MEKIIRAAVRMRAGLVAAGRRVNERSVELEDKYKGRILQTQQIEMSADMKSLTVRNFGGGKQGEECLCV